MARAKVTWAASARTRSNSPSFHMRREAQLALQRAQEQLAQSQKMEALGQLTGGIAHDFNNLLTILGGQARIVKNNAADPKSLKAADAIETTVQRGAALTRQLLGFSRRQQLEPQAVALAERIPGLKTMLATSLSANLQLVASVLPDIWPVVADPSELDLAIMNLVLNARDAMPVGGLITIAAENVTAPHSQLDETLKGEFVCISVIDNGDGIPADVLPKVFDPFFTTKAVGRGTGLGLSQVYGFAHQSGGTVRIESEVGKGTRVTICLPRADKPKQAQSTAGKEANSARRHARILMVEDNTDVTEVTSALIKQLGYTVRLAPDAIKALRMMEEESFDLVFTDIMMPGGMDGLELAKTIFKSRPRLPVLLASGSNQLVEEALQHFTTLQKPYEISDLDRAIQVLLRAREDAADGNNLVDLSKAKRKRGKPDKH